MEEAASREIFEETGIEIHPEALNQEATISDPKRDKRQNVITHFVHVMVDVDCETVSKHFSHEHNEKNEVGEIKFIPITDIDKYKWAFNHENLIVKYARMYNL